MPSSWPAGNRRLHQVDLGTGARQGTGVGPWEVPGRETGHNGKELHRAAGNPAERRETARNDKRSWDGAAGSGAAGPEDRGPVCEAWG